MTADRLPAFLSTGRTPSQPAENKNNDKPVEKIALPILPPANTPQPSRAGITPLIF
jgi:hypothetical protein